MSSAEIPTWDDLLDLLHASQASRSLSTRQSLTLEWVRNHPTAAHIRLAKQQQAEREYLEKQAVAAEIEARRPPAKKPTKRAAKKTSRLDPADFREVREELGKSLGMEEER